MSAVSPTDTANSADVLEVVNAFYLKAIGSVALKTWTDIDDYLTTASLLHSNRKRWLPAYQRLTFSRRSSVSGLCIQEISYLAGKQIPMDLTAAGAGRIAFTTREPNGFVVAVSAFNHPSI